MNATKDVTIGNLLYRVGELSARDGSWVVGQFLPRMLQLTPEAYKDDKNLGLTMSILMSAVTEDVFDSIREKCFAVCFQQEKDMPTPTPLLMQNGTGKWAVRTPPDLVAATALITATLVFNLRPFFEPGALETLRQLFPNMSPSAPSSTDTFSDPSQPGTGGTAS
jgi:hypothetical protein